MLKFIKSKKGLATLATLAALGSAIGAYAYFSSTGSGAGSGGTATAAALTISPIGAGYDSLLPISDGGYPGPYIQDQCLQNCSDLAAIGNQVNLQGVMAGNFVRLTSVVVAFRNWGPRVNPGGANNSAITIVVNGHSVKGYPDLAAGQTNGRPTVTNATFDFSTAAVGATFVSSPATYQVRIQQTAETTGLNVALSNSNNAISAGSDTALNTLWLSTTDANGNGGNDFPAGTVFPTTANSFEAVKTNNGPSAASNPGAYGTDTATNADIPAVELNIVGGIVPDLSPGQSAPVSFAITNPGTTNVTESHVVTSISSVDNGAGACSTEWNDPAHSPWYTVGNPSVGPVTVPPGTTLFTSTGTTLSMFNDPANNQNDCQGAAVHLAFASS